MCPAQHRPDNRSCHRCRQSRNILPSCQCTSKCVYIGRAEYLATDLHLSPIIWLLADIADRFETSKKTSSRLAEALRSLSTTHCSFNIVKSKPLCTGEACSGQSDTRRSIDGRAGRRSTDSRLLRDARSCRGRLESNRTTSHKCRHTPAGQCGRRAVGGGRLRATSSRPAAQTVQGEEGTIRRSDRLDVPAANGNNERTRLAQARLYRYLLRLDRGCRRAFNT